MGGYFSFSTISRASAAVSTCGMTMPSAPLSSARVAIAYSPFGTRAIGAMPASRAAVAIWAQASSDMTPCSMSRNSQSTPATAIALAISTLRVMRTPTPNDNCPCSSFSRAGFVTAAVIGGSSMRLGYSLAARVAVGIGFLAQPVAEGPDLGPLQRARRGHDVIGEEVGQRQREQAHQTSGADVGGGDRAVGQHHAVPSDRRV